MLYLVFYVFVIALIFCFEKEFFKKDLNLFRKFSFKKLILCLSSFLFVTFLLTFLLMKLGLVEYTRREFNFSINLLPILVQTIIVSPFVEEYIFRYVPNKFANNGKNFIILMLISSFLFTIFHNFNVYEIFITFISAIMLFIICYRTKRLTYSFICHSVYNLLIITFTYISDVCYLIASLFSLFVFVLFVKNK
ncbi:MAG: CPBP family intramembrane metalloprotease [Tenericutes bacterium]|nr:CPBP family intramembrane metalloprotease [Mycoplasmatota bacterium]